MSHKGLTVDRTSERLQQISDVVVSELCKAERPLVVFGGGLRASTERSQIHHIMEAFGVPCQRTRSAIDLFSDENVLSAGRPGAYGQKFANELLYRSDHIVFLGCRLGETFTGRRTSVFAPDATKSVISLEIDTQFHLQEMRKLTVFREDLRAILPRLEASIARFKPTTSRSWLESCLHTKSQELEKLRWNSAHRDKNWDLYSAINALSRLMPDGCIIVIDGGLVTHVVNQVFETKSDQQILLPSGQESPLFAVPALVGVMSSRSPRPMVAITTTTALAKDADLIDRIHNALPHNQSAHIFAMETSHYSTWELAKGSLYPLTGPQSLDSKRRADHLRPPSTVNYIRIPRPIDMSQITSNVFWQRKGLTLCEIALEPTLRVHPRPRFQIAADGSWIQHPLNDME